ncbi:MAG: hypothetical protein ABI415_03355 [Flavitalea sp.]
MKLIITFLFIFFIGLTVSGQTITLDSVAPRTTDPNIETGAFNLRHYMAKSDQDTMNTLVVLLPGTYRAPANYLFITEQLALMGYHVIGLMYKTDPAINPICRPTDDVTCHYRSRMETIDGTDRHPSVSVNVPNSILNRLEKVLQYQINAHPTAGWQQYYSGGQIQWNKIIVTGHSQGASLAGILGKEFPVKRIVMFSVIDFLDSGNIPNWVANVTNHENYYAFIHPKDEQVPFSNAQIGWENLGMTEYGSMVNIDCNSYPYNNSHILYTSYTPSVSMTDKYHNGTALDIYIKDETAYKSSLKEALKYLFKK